MRVRARTMLLITAQLLIAGCASMRLTAADRALNPATVTLPQNFALAPDVVAQDRSTLEDLIPVSDLAFTELRTMAEENAPSLAAALARIDQARAQSAAADANRQPTFGANASATGTRQNPDSFGGGLPPGINIDRYRTSLGGNISASWDPDIFGQLRASQRAANIRIDAATADAAAVRQSLIAAIAGNVIDWRTVVARDENLQNDVATAQDLFRFTNSRVRAGLSPDLDAVQAEALLEQVKAQIPPLQSERARIIGALITLTGKPASDVMASLSKATPAGSLKPVAATTPAAMLRARPDVAAAEARLAAADADIAAAAAQRFPKLTLSGTLGLLTFGLGDIFNANTLIGSLGAAIAGPLLDFGRIDAQIDASKARTKEAFADYRGIVFTALGDAETAYGQAAAARAEVTALEKQKALETDAVYLAGIRYKSGLTDIRTVLTTQRQLNVVRASISLAQGRHDRARIALWLALGGS
jgi:NodT family efflux transporter outer membrane factor (OMF) lipoprotein